MNTSSSWLFARRASGANSLRATRPGAGLGAEIMVRAGAEAARPSLGFPTCGLADGDALAEHCQERIDAAAVALDDRGELVPLRHFHADAGDIDVTDLEGAAALDNIPVDENAAAARPVDLARDHRLVAA